MFMKRMLFFNFIFRMYQDKLANLKKQLQQLEEGNHPDYLKRLKKLEQNYKTRLLLNEVFERIEVRSPSFFSLINI